MAKTYDRAQASFDSLVQINRNEDARIGEYLDEIAPALNAFPAMLAALEAVEWSGKDNYADYYRECLVCEEYKDTGHATDCQLAATLKLARGEG